MRKIPFPILLMIFVVMIVGGLSIAIISGIIPFRDIFTSFYTFVFLLVFISILAIIGALFVGIFVSHRVFSSRQFTAFEEEMLKMKEDVEYIKENLEESEEERSD